MEKEGKNALEMAKEEKAKDKARAEEKSRRTLIRCSSAEILWITR